MMEFEHDYFAILGLGADADEREIKQAYRHLALRYHPDTSADPSARGRFLEIQEAYEFLIDPIQREAYIAWRHRQGLDRPLPISLRLTPSQSTLPCLNEHQLLYVLVEISADRDLEAERLPLNLALVLDHSTSMKGARLQQVKEAARYIVDQMQPHDVLSLAVFSDKAQVVLPGRRGIDRSAARAAISGIRSEGGTELLQGLKLGLKELERWHTKEMHSHLILLTDGQTYGDETGCLETARYAASQQIQLTMMGIGSDWNDKLLDEMADLSHGTSVYIDNSAKIAEAFREQLQSLGDIYAQDLVMNTHLIEGSSVQEAFRVSPQINPLRIVDNSVSLGVLKKQQPQAMMLELLVGKYNPGEHRLLRVDLEGTIPALGRQPVRIREALTLSFELDLGRRSPIPSDIVSAMGKLTIYKMQERAMEDIELGRIEPAVTRLKSMATRLLDLGEVELARAALLEAGRLARTGSLSSEGGKQIRYGTRGLGILANEVRK